ncbi:MAG TPA: aldo/keto reductase [Candidatus Saccharimonadales bacterium]|jgi:diketogulonate reductase-like aldo/keto reductase|nr:aldo/keto reductase [Candidatus Saccharimonadales bacterium]
MTDVPKLKLNDGHEIPQIGLGTWQSKDPAKFATALEAAFAAGYRHFDTAQAYHNEQMLGEAWQKSGLKREDIFITTKNPEPNL